MVACITLTELPARMLFVPTLERRLYIPKKWFENTSVQKIFPIAAAKTFHSTREEAESARVLSTEHGTRKVTELD
jgi:hypothetical protein